MEVLALKCEEEIFLKKYDEFVLAIAENTKNKKKRPLNSTQQQHQNPVPKLLAAPNSSYTKNCKVLKNYTVSMEKCKEVLANIKSLLDFRSVKNGQRFRASYSYENLPPKALFFDKIRVCELTTTRPCCLICKKDLNPEEDRIKYSVYYFPDKTQCDTHAYHVDCFLVSQYGKLEKAMPICIATCSNTGCKKSKKLKMIQ